MMGKTARDDDLRLGIAAASGGEAEVGSGAAAADGSAASVLPGDPGGIGRAWPRASLLRVGSPLRPSSLGGPSLTRRQSSAPSWRRSSSTATPSSVVGVPGEDAGAGWSCSIRTTRSPASRSRRATDHGPVEDEPRLLRRRRWRAATMARPRSRSVSVDRVSRRYGAVARIALGAYASLVVLDAVSRATRGGRSSRRTATQRSRRREQRETDSIRTSHQRDHGELDEDADDANATDAAVVG